MVCILYRVCRNLCHKCRVYSRILNEKTVSYEHISLFSISGV